MLSHDRVWAASTRSPTVTRCRRPASPSGRASNSTAFNKSKRLSVGWPAALAVDGIMAKIIVRPVLRSTNFWR